MVTDLIKKSQGCLIGLAAGDALGGPCEGKSMTRIRTEYGRIVDFISPEQASSDDTEFALFNARLLLRHGDRLTSDLIADAWLSEIAGDRTDFKGAGFSEVLAITNLRNGLRPPATGVHLHAWSDGLAMRVAPFAIYYARSPRQAAHMAEIDGAVSHSGEGIFAGQVVAVVISRLIMDHPPAAAIAEALTFIPQNSWTWRAIRTALAIAEKSRNVWEALPLLHEALANTCFPWADLAPEAVGMAFGLVMASRGNFKEAVLGGANIGRDADTIAALAGAMLGACSGIEVVPEEWAQRVRYVSGKCIPATADIDIFQVASDLARMASGRKIP